MLQAETRWYSNRFVLKEDDGHVATLKPSWWRERATLHVEDEAGDYDLYREGWFSGAFVLQQQQAGSVLVRAAKPSAWRNRFELTTEGQHFEVERESIFRRGFAVRRLAGGATGRGFGDDATHVGRIAPQHAFTRRAQIDLPERWPLPVRAFTFWLALLIWNRESGAAAGGAASG